jgi:lysophospholipase L1-like esterase
VAPPLDLDEDAVSMMVSAARQLAAVSERIFVVRDILNPALVLPEQETAWRAIASRIAHEAGVPLLDLNDGMVAAADFGDRTHLNPLAAERFSAALAARLKPGLIQNHASR